MMIIRVLGHDECKNDCMIQDGNATFVFPKCSRETVIQLIQKQDFFTTAFPKLLKEELKKIEFGTRMHIYQSLAWYANRYFYHVADDVDPSSRVAPRTELDFNFIYAISNPIISS